MNRKMNEKKNINKKNYFLKTLFVLMYTLQVIYVYLDYGTLVKLN